MPQVFTIAAGGSIYHLWVSETTTASNIYSPTPASYAAYTAYTNAIWPTMTSTTGSSLYDGWNSMLSAHQMALAARAQRDLAAEAARLHENHFLSQARREEFARRRYERDAAAHRAEVHVKARALLLRHLNDEQKESYLANGEFIVVGRSGARYAIHGRHLTGNVAVLGPDGRPTHRLCGHADRIPIGDQLLAQKLMLESAEEDFLAIANRHPA